MKERGKQDPSPIEDLYTLYSGPSEMGPVFPGKPLTPNPFQSGGIRPTAKGIGQPNSSNLAVQRSIMEIFDEFTEIVSGELKSMRMDEWKEERRQSPKP